MLQRSGGKKGQQLPYLAEGEYLSLFPPAEAGQLPGEQPPGAQCPSPDGAGAGEGGEDPGPGSRHDQVGTEVPGGEYNQALCHECRGHSCDGEVRWPCCKQAALFTVESMGG